MGFDIPMRLENCNAIICAYRDGEITDYERTLIQLNILDRFAHAISATIPDLMAVWKFTEQLDNIDRALLLALIDNKSVADFTHDSNESESEIAARVARICKSAGVADIHAAAVLFARTIV